LSVAGFQGLQRTIFDYIRPSNEGDRQSNRRNALPESGTYKTYLLSCVLAKPTRSSRRLTASTYSRRPIDLPSPQVQPARRFNVQRPRGLLNLFRQSLQEHHNLRHRVGSSSVANSRESKCDGKESVHILPSYTLKIKCPHKPGSQTSPLNPSSEHDRNPSGRRESKSSSRGLTQVRLRSMLHEDSRRLSRPRTSGAPRHSQARLPRRRNTSTSPGTRGTSWWRT
jgi:hypothetical protein